MTATATRPDQRERVETPMRSARERIQKGRPLRFKDVEVPELGRFRVRVLTQREHEEADEPVTRREADMKGNLTIHMDTRGHKARRLAFGLINDDGSNLYSAPMVEGVREIGDLPKDVVDTLYAALDELNGFSKEAREELGKTSAPTPSAAGS
jgi:hypothetical protein